MKTSTVTTQTPNAKASMTLEDMSPAIPLPDAPQGLMVLGPQVTLHFVEGDWNKANTYDYYDVVQVDGTSYIAVQDVPANTEITDTDYWAKWNDPNAQVQQMQDTISLYNSRISALENRFYVVGENCPYKTIQEAFNKANADGGGTIIIMPGEYDEAIAAPATRPPVSFIGVSKDKCIWKSSEYGYDNACFAGTGDYTFQNLTFIKGEENGGAMHSTQVNDGGYALHFDSVANSGTVLVDNCFILSYENCAIGCGTRLNQHLIFTNNVIKSVTRTTWSNLGCFIYHTSLAAEDMTGQQIDLVNNNFIYEGNGKVAMTLHNNGTNNVTINPTFINNKLSSPLLLSDWSSCVTFTNSATGKLELTGTKCFGNDIPQFNYTGAIVNGNGSPVDRNNVDETGFMVTSNFPNKPDFVKQVTGITLNPYQGASAALIMGILDDYIGYYNNNGLKSVMLGSVISSTSFSRPSSYLIHTLRGSNSVIGIYFKANGDGSFTNDLIIGYDITANMICVGVMNDGTPTWHTLAMSN